MMKLSYVEIAGFRGFREKTRFDFPAGFVVFTGRNGAGKSTVLDAIDFVLTGSIDKFPTKTAKGGGLSEHVWWVGNGRPAEHFVSVGFVGPDGEPFSITRGRDGVMHSSIDGPLNRLCVASTVGIPALETLMRTTLIRDENIVALSVDLPEQQRFAAVRAAIGGLVGPDHSKRTGEVMRAAETAEANQQRRGQQAQEELGRALSELTVARSAAERSPAVADALKLLADTSLELPSDASQRIEAVREYVADRRLWIDRVEEARLDAEALGPELQYIRSQKAIEELQSARAMVEGAEAGRKRAEEIFASAQRADTAEREGDAFAAHLATIIEHGEAIGLQEGHCPLCEAVRTDNEFANAIADARRRLSTRGERLAASSSRLSEAAFAFETASQTLSDAIERLAAENERREACMQRLAEIEAIYELEGFKAPPENPAAAQEVLLRERESLARLERALHILESSSAVDQVASLEVRIADLRKRAESEAGQLISLSDAFQKAKQIHASAQTVANELLTEQFDTVMPLLKELYRRLRPHVAWKEIDSDFGGKVRASLNFLVGDGHNLQFLFSSGQRRAAGLAFLLAIHLSRRWCAWNSLLLDDPVQHIDDYRALNLVEVLASIRRSGRQVIVAVEDGALADLLCRRMRASVGEIGRRYELQTGISGAAEIGSVQDIGPMPRLVLRSAG